MTDTVKLIIEIPKETYDGLINNRGVVIPSYWHEYVADLCKNGTPLDDVKAEIADIYCGQYCENPLTADAVREMVLDILDNIGKTESEETE